MYKQLVVLCLLALSLSFSVFASEKKDETTEQTEESSKKVEEQSTGPLDSGHGWQHISSLELGKSGKFAHMVLVDKDKTSDRTVYNSAINRICGKAEEFCRIRFWNQKKYIPEKIALNPEQSRNLLVEHTFNKQGGIHETRWSCSVNPARQDCFTQ